MSKLKRARYTLVQARSGTAGESRAAPGGAGSVEPDAVELVQSDRNGTLVAPGTKPVSTEQMELARLRAGVSR